MVWYRCGMMMMWQCRYGEVRSIINARKTYTHNTLNLSNETWGSIHVKIKPSVKKVINE